MIKEFLLSSALIISPIEINFSSQIEDNFLKTYERKSLYDLVIKQPLLAIKEDEDDSNFYLKKERDLKKRKDAFYSGNKCKLINYSKKSNLYRKTAN